MRAFLRPPLQVQRQSFDARPSSPSTNAQLDLDLLCPEGTPQGLDADTPFELLVLPARAEQVRED